MVQPTLDYASTAWDPHTKEDINTLDKVQRRGARFVCNNYTDRTPGCVTAMLNSLEWIPLSTRRYHQRLIMLYKIQHFTVDIGQFNILRRATVEQEEPTDCTKYQQYRVSTSTPSSQGQFKIGTAYQHMSQTAHHWRNSKLQ